MSTDITDLKSNCSEQVHQARLALIQLDQQQMNAIAQTVPGGAKNVQDIYPLSPLQEGLLFHHLMDEKHDTYVLSTLLELQPRIETHTFVRALQKVIDRHDALRTAVMWERLSRPVQVVYRKALLPMAELSLDPQLDPVEQLLEMMKPDRQSLQVGRAPLLRLLVATHGEKRYAILQVHHVTCDYQSVNVALTEVMTYLQGREQALADPEPYRDYVASALAHAEGADAETFFREKLGDVEMPTVPFGVLDAHGDTARVVEESRALEAALSQRLRKQARCLGVSPARIFHAVWALIAARTSGRDDVVFGTVLLSAHRRKTQALHTLGLFVNTLPLRLRLHGVTARELVEQAHRELAELVKYDQVPLTLAQRCSGNGGAVALFTSLLNYRHGAAELEAEDAISAGFRVLARRDASNYPLALTVDDLRDGFVLTVKSDPRIDPHRVVQYVLTAIRSLVEALEQAPQTPALALPILPDGERHQVIDSFNATKAPYPREAMIHELFERQVERTPDLAAVVCEGRCCLRFTARCS